MAMNQLFMFFAIALLCLGSKATVTLGQDLSVEDYCKIRVGITPFSPLLINSERQIGINLHSKSYYSELYNPKVLNIKITRSNLPEIGQLIKLDNLILKDKIRLMCFERYYKALLIQLKQDYLRQLVLHYEKLTEKETDSQLKETYNTLRGEFINKRNAYNDSLKRDILNLNLPSVYYEKGLSPNLTSKYITVDKLYQLNALSAEFTNTHPLDIRQKLIQEIFDSNKYKKNKDLHDYLNDLAFFEKESLQLELRKSFNNLNLTKLAMLELDYIYYSAEAEFLRFLDLNYYYNISRIRFLHVIKKGPFSLSPPEK